MTVEIVDNGVALDGVTFSDPNVTASSKNSHESERRHRRRKQKNKNRKESEVSEVEEGTDSKKDTEVSEEIAVEYVPEHPEFEEEGFEDEFRKIFEKFSYNRESIAKDETEEKAELYSDSSFNSDSEKGKHEKEKSISKKEKKLEKRMKISELKQLSGKPDVVEVCDADSTDPKLLVFLKSCRNTIPVPIHWSQKRKYLQGNRGIEKKKPYQLPDYIAATGIEKLRESYIKKEDCKKLKTKQRDRMQPKMARMDIDYQVLHDAFFKYQTKPKMSGFGDLYFEGKEFEVVNREMKPGVLSCELKEALGMTEATSPPPWLVNMQRYGPPPSYPNLKIPGLIAPIGSRFGYPPIDKSKHWGDLKEEDEEEEEEEEEEEQEEEEDDDIESVEDNESPDDDVIELRKEQRKEEPFYQVLEEKRESVVAPGALLGTTHTYVIKTGDGIQDKTGGGKRVDLMRGQKSDRVEVSFNPEELDAMENVLPGKYEEAMEEEKLWSQREDLSDMVAENERKRKLNDKEGKMKKNKKKDFKF